MDNNELLLAQSENETRKHIDEVRKRLLAFAHALIGRAMRHDASKLIEPEASRFATVTAKLAGVTFGSAEYESFLKELKPALDHHYANNDHHPQHFKNGIDDMNLLQIIELFCDWDASSKRHNDGNINHSIDHNAKRFAIDHQLTQILRNTIKELP